MIRFSFAPRFAQALPRSSPGLAPRRRLRLDLAALFVENVAPLDEAGPGSLTFFDNSKYLDDLAVTHALACFVPPRFAARVPPATLALLTPAPARDLTRVLAQLYPDALAPGTMFDSKGESPGADIHPEARLEPDVVVDPGVVIGPHAEVGSGTTIGANVGDRPECANWARLRHRARRVDRQCADRQQGHHPRRASKSARTGSALSPGRMAI